MAFCSLPIVSIHQSAKSQISYGRATFHKSRTVTRKSFSFHNLRICCSSSLTQSSIHGSEEEHVVRRLGDYHPSIWGDHFLEYKCDEKALDASRQRIDELKEEVRQMLVAYANNSLPKMMDFIDTLQRLGVAYHFETEIGAVLEGVVIDKSYYQGDDLYKTSLEFRILRQGGYNVSCDVFHKYKDQSGHFKESLIDDIPGLLSLFEAVHLRVHGEEVLDEALAFTTSNLMKIKDGSSSLTAKQVSHALNGPLHKSMPRLEARFYISVYEKNDKHNKLLLEFAKLDYNILQSLHLKELSLVFKWWKDWGFVSKLPYARERVVEQYFWALGIYYEPQYSLARVIMNKTFAMVSMLDDTYDIYGTLEELNLFTDVVKRWDITAVDQLPEYMKVIFLALVDFYNEVEDSIGKDGKAYLVNQAKDLMVELLEAYIVEENWCKDGYVPTMEDYMENALVSSSGMLLPFHSFLGMGEVITEEAYDWVKNDVIPNRAFAEIGRFMDDIRSHEAEQKRRHVSSSVECFMNQYKVSKEEACNVFDRRIKEGWKNLNKGCLKPTVVPLSLLERILNITRMIDVIYRDGDGYNDPHMVLKESISSLLIDPIPI